MSYKEGFESFAEQLVREFSIKNLLFLLEMVQIKDQILARKLLKSAQIEFMLEFDKKVMHIRRENSKIRNMDECMVNIGWIVDHYIDAYADYAVNISSTVRNRILTATELIRDQNKVAKAKELNEIKKKNLEKLGFISESAEIKC